MLDIEYSSPVGACPAAILSAEGGHGKRNGLPVSDIEVDEASVAAVPQDRAAERQSLYRLTSANGRVFWSGVGLRSRSGTSLPGARRDRTCRYRQDAKRMHRRSAKVRLDRSATSKIILDGSASLPCWLRP